MEGSLEANREKSVRIFDFLPVIFNSGYIAEQGILSGGTAINLRMNKRRFPTDIDLKDENHLGLGFRERFDFFADELREAAESLGYGFKISVEHSPKGKLYYTNALGLPDNITVDICLSAPCRLPTEQVDTQEAGRIRTMNLEEMLGSKTAMLSRPRLRGHKRFGDLLDVYNSTYNQLDNETLKAMFIYVMTELGVQITPGKLDEMVSWHNPKKFEDGIRAKTDSEVNFETVKTRVISHYNFLCQLVPQERKYNQRLSKYQKPPN